MAIINMQVQAVVLFPLMFCTVAQSPLILQCTGSGSSSGPQDGQCIEIQSQQLPDCRAHHVNRNNLPLCPYNYLSKPRSVWYPQTRPGTFDECTERDGLYRGDCSVGIVETEDRDLNVSLVPHNINEANLTVSWGHLHLNIPPGSILELKLVDSECIRTDCFDGLGYYTCVNRYRCTMNISQTSVTFGGVRYREVNEVQFAIVNGSVATTTIRTQFADRISAFQCTNTDIIPYDIERCPPERYGSVRNLTAKLESVGDEDTVMCVVSWLPPQEDELFHAALHYHLTLATVTAGGVHTDIRYFNVSMTLPAVSISSLNSSLNYSIGVRAYVLCSGCATPWGNTTPPAYPTPSPYSTPSEYPTTIVSTTPLPSLPSTTPVPSPYSTTIVSTTPLPSPPSTTPVPSPLPNEGPPSHVLLISIPVMVVAVAAIVTLALVVTLALLCCKKRPNVSDVRDPSSVATPNALTLSSEGTEKEKDMSPLQMKNFPVINGYIQMTHPPGPLRENSSLPEFNPNFLNSTGSVSGNSDTNSLRLDDPGSGAKGEAEPTSEGEEELLNTHKAFNPLNVLIVYALETPEKNYIRSKLVAGLDEYEDINPICYDLVSLRNEPSYWLETTIPHVDAVLCVCTDKFRQDWDDCSSFIGMLNTVICAKRSKKESYSNFAAVLLKERDVAFVPGLLARNQKLMIDHLDNIAAFVKDIPQCVLRKEGGVLGQPFS